MIRLQDALVLALLGDGGNEVQPRGDVCRSGGADEHAVVVDPAAGGLTVRLLDLERRPLRRGPVERLHRRAYQLETRGAADRRD